jgi:hypothetical protein
MISLTSQTGAEATTLEISDSEITGVMHKGQRSMCPGEHIISTLCPHFLTIFSLPFILSSLSFTYVLISKQMKPLKN